MTHPFNAHAVDYTAPLKPFKPFHSRASARGGEIFINEFPLMFQRGNSGGEFGNRPTVLATVMDRQYA